MPKAAIDGESLFFAARGDRGVPVIFVHGAGSSHLVWNAQIAALSEQARAFGLDLPGHGRSDGMGRTNIRSYADSVCRFMDALALDRAIIAGHSMGGAVAQTLGVEDPDRVLGLVLAGTGARLRVLPEFLEGARKAFAKTVHDFNEAEFAPDADPKLKELSEEQMMTCGPTVFYGDLLSCDAFDAMTRVSEIRAPALVICGREDRMTPVKYSQYLAARIPHANLQVIEGAGHILMVEKADAVNRALLEWIPALELT